MHKDTEGSKSTVHVGACVSCLCVDVCLCLSRSVHAVCVGTCMFLCVYMNVHICMNEYVSLCACM